MATISTIDSAINSSCTNWFSISYSYFLSGQTLWIITKDFISIKPFSRYFQNVTILTPGARFQNDLFMEKNRLETQFINENYNRQTQTDPKQGTDLALNKEPKND